MSRVQSLTLVSAQGIFLDSGKAGEGETICLCVYASFAKDTTLSTNVGFVTHCNHAQAGEETMFET